MSPSISSNRFPAARAKLTANWLATLVFPSRLAALVTARIRMSLNSVESAKLVRRLSMLSSNSRKSRLTLALAEPWPTGERIGRWAISPSTDSLDCRSSVTGSPTRPTIRSQPTANANGKHRQIINTTAIGRKGNTSTGVLGGFASRRRLILAGASRSVWSSTARWAIKSNTFSARATCSRLKPSANVSSLLCSTSFRCLS